MLRTAKEVGRGLPKRKVDFIHRRADATSITAPRHTSVRRCSGSSFCILLLSRLSHLDDASYRRQQAADWHSHSKAADSLRFNRGVPRDHCNRAQHICRAGLYFRHTLKTLERLLRAALQMKCAERTFATDLWLQLAVNLKQVVQL